MMSFWKRQSCLLAVALAAGGALGSIGCEGRYTGGGYTASIADGNAKATFGLEVAAIDTDGDGAVVEFVPGVGGAPDPDDQFRGTFSFSDMREGVAINGTIDAGFVIPQGSRPFDACTFPCTKPSQYQVDGSGMFVGTYVPIPSTLGPGGHFEVLVVDNGEPGVSDPEDEIWVWVESGVHAGYSNRIGTWVFGKIEGGNIQFHPLN